MTLSLRGKTALITGASRGIGRATALKFASLGADLILHYRKNLEEAAALEAELKEKFGVQVDKVAADLSDLTEIHRFIEEVRARHSRLDIFVANAAATAFKPLSEIKEHHIAKTMNITVTAFILAMNAFKPLMPPGSKAITVSGIDTKSFAPTMACSRRPSPPWRPSPGIIRWNGRPKRSSSTGSIRAWSTPIR